MSVKKSKSGKTNKLAGYSQPATTENTGTSRYISRNGKSGRKSTTVVAGRGPMPPSKRVRIIKGSIDSAGRILVPVKLRKALNLEPGDDVNLELKGDVLEIRSLDDAINEAQALVRKYVPKKESLVDELIADRRADAKKE